MPEGAADGAPAARRRDAPSHAARRRGDLWAIPDFLAEARGCSLPHAQRLYRKIRPRLVAGGGGVSIQSLRFPRASGRGLSAPVDCATVATLCDVLARLPPPKQKRSPRAAAAPGDGGPTWREAELASQVRRRRGGYYCAADAVCVAAGLAPGEAARLYWLVKQAHASPALLARARPLAFAGQPSTYVDCYAWPDLVQVLRLALALAAPAAPPPQAPPGAAEAVSSGRASPQAPAAAAEAVSSGRASPQAPPAAGPPGAPPGGRRGGGAACGGAARHPTGPARQTWRIYLMP
eukprot:g54015.t1